ncbi:hypothetical protein AB0A98_39430 [Streptomyces chrestomyceticus]|uniref:hypothetical protein n=1 Tax=Streptomyces chrestomyceticus TaxID=68185 RepID=UPI003402E93C
MTADEFNALYAVGTPVIAYPGIRPQEELTGLACERIVTRTRTTAWTPGHGRPVVMVEDHGAHVALTHIDVAHGEGQP